MTRIGMFLFDGAEELDFVGPWEVFTMAAQLRSDLRVVTIAERADAVRCAKGMRVLPDHTIADAPALDLVLVPGGQGTRREVDNPRAIGWLREIAPSLRWITSVYGWQWRTLLPLSAVLEVAAFAIFFRAVSQHRAAGGESTRVEPWVLVVIAASTGFALTLTMNLGAAIYVSGLADSLEQGVEKALALIASGAARRKVDELAVFTTALRA